MTSIVELGVAQVAVWWVAGTVLVASWWVLFGGQHRNPRHDRELAWWLWHWFMGGPLETARSYPGGGGRPRRVLRRMTRAAGRTGLAAGFVAAIYLRSGAAHGTGFGTVVGWGVGGAIGLAAFTAATAALAVEWSMWRHYVQPLHWALADKAGWDLDMRWWRVRRYIRIHRGLADHIEGVIIICGPTFEPRDEVKKKVIEIVTAKLGLKDAPPSWKQEGIHRYVQFRAQDPVPDKVPFRNPEIRELIETLSTWSKVLLGFTRGGKPVWLDLDKESPHVLMSAGTGGGKSVALAGITSQLMWHGADVVVLDIKEMSHLWLRDLPGVRYARTTEEIHRTLCDLGREVDRRKARLREVSAEQVWAGEVPEFPRLVIVFEEMSTTTRRLRSHWTSVKVKGDPNVSPALQAYEEILNMGRQLKMNMLSVAQRASANAVGSGDARENYPCRILIDRYSKQTWTILNGDLTFVPGVNHPGRAQVVIGADGTATQILHITEPDAYRWVIDKRGMQPRKQPDAHPAHTLSPGEMVRVSRASASAQGVEPVTLYKASSDKGDGIVKLTAGALRNERLRHPGEFPAPIVKRGEIELYDPFDLQRWENNKVKKKRSDTSDEVAEETNETDGVGRVDGNENESSAEEVPQGGWLLPDGAQRVRLRDRFEAGRAAPNEAGCRQWTGYINEDGYGYMKVDGVPVPVHRVAYELLRGPIPEGHTIDHLIGPGEPCTSKACTTGDHLEAVTREQNSARRHERDKAQQGATS